MPLEVLTGHDVPSLLTRAQRTLGEDAVVLAVRRVRNDGVAGFEMTVADPRTAEHQRRLERASSRGAEAVLAADRPVPPRHPVDSPFAGPGRSRQGLPGGDGWPAPRSASAPPALQLQRPRRFALPNWPARSGEAARRRPFVIALVGPTGAGKTTTCPKLVHHELAFAGRKVGFLNLDTFRVGAVEQAKHWAELARVPVETVWERSEIPRAMHRLRDREVIVVDTPGRGPRAASDLTEVQARLLELATDEVHLVVPAGVQRAVMHRTFTTYLPLGVTHVLPTKLDDHPDERVVFEVASQFGLPMRWLTDGQEVPGDLHAAPSTGADHPARGVAA